MKNIVLFGFVVLLVASGCARKFTLAEIATSQKKYKKYSLKDFSLYLRAICTKTEDEKRIPCNCSETQRDTVERTYLFISKNSDSVLAIQHIADRNQRFFNKVVDSKLTSDTLRDFVSVNIWPFAQFRFGLMKNDRVTFRTTWQRPEEHLWVLEFDDDAVEVKAVGKQTCGSLDLRTTDAALALTPVFRKVNGWKFIYQETDFLGRSEKPLTVPQELYLESLPDRRRRRRIQTFFLVNATDWEHNALRFKPGRMYSFHKRENDECIEELYH
jgi:hypothetical protein